MRYKILTVDDSKTVRILVQKAFRSYGCEIFEANNGEEGLVVAAKEAPHLILLDITMPVMDGVQMLERLKAHPTLKAVPVIMLTAEGGRDTVLKIAKMGVRDYLIKPFKESVLIGKVSRVIDLQAPSAADSKPKSITDSTEILVLEETPEAAQEIQDGLKHMPWKIRHAATLAEANTACTQGIPDLIVASLGVANDAAFTLLRDVRATAKLKNVPVVAVAAKADIQHQKAQTAGFNAVLLKPFDFADVETKFVRAMHLDTSQRYYGVHGDTVTIGLPTNCVQAVLDEITVYLTPKLTQAKTAGCTKLLVDAHEPAGLNIGMIKFLLLVMKKSQEFGLRFAMIGNGRIVADCQAFEDTRDWTFFETSEQARHSLGQGTGGLAHAVVS